MARKPRRAHVGSAPLPERQSGERLIRWRQYQVYRRQRGGWVGKVRGAHKASLVEHFKEDAVRRTCEIARNNPPSVVYIYRENRTFEESRVYRD